MAIGKNMRREEDHLDIVLRVNGYPAHIIRSAARPRKEREHKYPVCIPYVAGVSEDLRRVCRRYDIRTVFTTIYNLRQQLSRVKDPDPMLSKAGVVYRIPCSCGKTKRVLGVRLKEHQAATRQGEIETSAIAEHAWEKQHHPAWDEIVILEQARRDDHLRIKEAFCIAMADQERSLNRDRGTAIAECWKPLLRRHGVRNVSAMTTHPPARNSTPDLPCPLTHTADGLFVHPASLLCIL